ncbi:MAG: metallophosphoesterase [Lentisphaerae bacterium]|nr:metallophosphoesterase [Lentisphaerota bacterium]
MNAVIISDVHIGSPHCRLEAFLHFLRHLPPDTDLILNGDIVHRVPGLPPEHAEAVAALVRESGRRRVVWIRGNHDRWFTPDDPGRIEFVDSWDLEHRLHVTHGHELMALASYNRGFILLFRLLYYMRNALGGRSMHVALYAKKWPRLYRILTEHLASNAARYAADHGYEAVACGHVHFAEDRTVAGIRYLNTGSWTEDSAYCVRIEAGEAILEKVSI